LIRFATAIFVCALSCQTAVGAEVTDIPPALRGTVRIDYAGQTEFANIVEAETYFGKRRITAHSMTYSAEFAPIDGFGIKLALPTSPARSVGFTEAYEMYYEPVNNGGTYTFGEAFTEDIELSGKGGQGFYAGAILAPVSEQFGWNTGVSWRVDIGYRSGTKTNFWTVKDGQRGAGQGGGAFRLDAAFSTDKGISIPYAQVQYTKESKVEVDVVDENGTLWASNLKLQPPSSVAFRSGVEIVAVEEQADGSRWTVDLFTHFRYETWSDVPSGIYLPSVLDGSRTIPVRVSDHASVGAGLGLNAHITQYVGLRTSVRGVYTIPYQIEHVYPVYTSADNFGIEWSVGLDGKIR
jgi:hypothetical protein